MTEQKTTSLTPDEWKQLCVLNCAQLQRFLDGIPSQIESGAVGLTAEHLTLIDLHVQRGRAFLTAWAASKPAAVPEQAKAAAANGEDKPKKGGWPKGKKRNAGAAVQQ